MYKIVNKNKPELNLARKKMSYLQHFEIKQFFPSATTNYAHFTENIHLALR